VFAWRAAARTDGSAASPFGDSSAAAATQVVAASSFSSVPAALAQPAVTQSVITLEQMPQAAREGIKLLQRGVVATKFGRQGKPHSCLFKLSEDLHTLAWERQVSSPDLPHLT
jgi:hypothetical protein